jgi:hypothetical protein
MADAILKLLRDPAHAQRLGTNGRIHATESFGVEQYVDGVQRVILRAVSG